MDLLLGKKLPSSDLISTTILPGLTNNLGETEGGKEGRKEGVSTLSSLHSWPRQRSSASPTFLITPRARGAGRDRDCLELQWKYKKSVHCKTL